MLKKLTTFRLNTLLGLVFVLAVGLSFYMRYLDCSRLAFDHYCNSLDSAYRAVAIQTMHAVPQRDKLFKYCEYEEWIPIVKRDRKTLNDVRKLWEDSIHHTSLKNHYWSIHNAPLLILSSKPERLSLTY